jgi:hypothetical protein
MTWFLFLFNLAWTVSLGIATLVHFAHTHGPLWWHGPGPVVVVLAVMLLLVVISFLSRTLLGGEAEAATMTTITTPVKNIVATVQDVGYVMAPLLFVGMLWHYHRGGFGVGTIIEIVGIVLIVAIIVYASDIITWIRPASAAANTLLASPVDASRTLWDIFGGSVRTLTALTMGIRYVRRGARGI